MLGRVLRLGVYKLSWQSKTQLENPIVVAPWTQRNHGGAGIEASTTGGLQEASCLGGI